MSVHRTSGFHLQITVQFLETQGAAISLCFSPALRCQQLPGCSSCYVETFAFILPQQLTASCKYGASERILSASRSQLLLPLLPPRPLNFGLGPKLASLILVPIWLGTCPPALACDLQCIRQLFPVTAVEISRDHRYCLVSSRRELFLHFFAGRGDFL